jgi:hypothetical protein
MQLAISLFPDIDGLDGLIESSMPVFAVLLFALALVLATLVVSDCLDRARHRSPVDRLLRRRFG